MEPLLLSLLLVGAVVVADPDDLRRLISDTLEDTLTLYLKRREPPPAQPPKTWLSNREAMEWLDLSRATLQRYRNDGRLPYSKLGGNVYYRRADLLRVLEEHRVNGNGH